MRVVSSAVVKLLDRVRTLDQYKYTGRRYTARCSDVLNTSAQACLRPYLLWGGIIMCTYYKSIIIIIYINALLYINMYYLKRGLGLKLYIIIRYALCCGRWVRIMAVYIYTYISVLLSYYMYIAAELSILIYL